MNKTTIEFFASEYVGAKSLSCLAHGFKHCGCTCQWSSKELFPSSMKERLILSISVYASEEDLKRIRSNLYELIYMYKLIVNKEIKIGEYNSVNLCSGIVKLSPNDYRSCQFKYLKREGLCCKIGKRLVPVCPICTTVFIPVPKPKSSLIARDMTDDYIGYIQPSQMKKASRIEIDPESGEVKLLVNSEGLIAHTHSRICELFDCFDEFVEETFASMSFHVNENSDLAIIDDAKTLIPSLHLFEIMLYHIGKQMVPKQISKENALYWLRFYKSDCRSLPKSGDEIRALQKLYSEETKEELKWEALAEYVDEHCNDLAYYIANVIITYPLAIDIDFNDSILIHPSTRNGCNDFVSFNSISSLMKSDIVKAYQDKVSVIIREFTIEIKGNDLDPLYKELLHLLIL